MLKKINKPSENYSKCVNMMIQGAKKRRMMAYAAINSLDGTSLNSNKVVSIK